MPTYGYRCQSCDSEFDVWQRMSDEAGAACPDCGGAGRRMIFPVGIVFKGSGFYKTDSRNGSALAAAGTTAESATADSSATPPAAKDGSKVAAATTAASGETGSGVASGSDSAGSGGASAAPTPPRGTTGRAEPGRGKQPRQSGSAA